MESGFPQKPGTAELRPQVFQFCVQASLQGLRLSVLVAENSDGKTTTHLAPGAGCTAFDLQPWREAQGDGQAKRGALALGKTTLVGLTAGVSDEKLAAERLEKLFGQRRVGINLLLDFAQTAAIEGLRLNGVVEGNAARQPYLPKRMKARRENFGIPSGEGDGLENQPGGLGTLRRNLRQRKEKAANGNDIRFHDEGI